MQTDLSQFFQVFFEESAEHLAEMERIFLAINPAEPDEEELHAVFRAAHSIKGGAATFGFPDMAEFTHTLETLLDRVRHRELPLTASMVEVFLEAGDAINMQLSGHRDGAHVDVERIGAVSGRLQSIAAAEAVSPAAPVPVAMDEVAEVTEQESTYHITFTPPPEFFMRMVRMEPLVEELSSLGQLSISAVVAMPDELSEFDPEQCRVAWEMRLTTTQTVEAVKDVFMFVADEEEIRIETLDVRSSDVPDATQEQPDATETGSAAPVAAAPPELQIGRRQYDREESVPGAFGRRGHDAGEASSIRVGVSKVDQLINQVGELVITQAMLAQSSQHLDPVLYEQIHRGLVMLERNTRNLQESVMSIRMLPISFIFNRFPRLVHDLAGKLGKQVELRLSGEMTELDKGLIEKLADPLTHLVRNSLDHGLEPPEQRAAAGKSACGVVTLKASQQGGRVIIEVIDDGAGLNRRKILDKARANGLDVSDDMSNEEVWLLIFAPGFSTAEQVTDVSGRGVGMDVVIRNVQNMGGRVSIFSEEGQGSRVLISLPLTLAILDGLSVRVGNEVFIVPLNSIVESLQPQAQEIREIGGVNTTVHVRGDYLPLVRLGSLFGLNDYVERPEHGVVMIVDTEGERVALLVDELLSQHQVVIKSLESNYRKVEGTVGATILGDGRVALILDTTGLVNMWRS